MQWWLIALILALSIILYFLYKPASTAVSPSEELEVYGGEVWLPANRYYTGLLTDTELEMQPLLDIAMPLPTFRTLGEGTVQLVNTYNYDYNIPMGGKRGGIVSNGMVAIKPLLQGLVQSSLASVESKAATANPLTILSCTKTLPYGVRVVIQAGEEIHALLFSFSPLTATYSIPRRAIKNVGYFSQQIVASQKPIDIIQCYRKKEVAWYPSPTIPSEWYSTLAEAVTYWDDHLVKAGGHVRLTFKPSPWTGDPSDPSINLFSLARSSGYIGVGTSAVDARNGEHLWSRINIDPSSLNNKAYLFPARDDHHLYLLRYAAIHEMGHTLGLRHNFVAQEDNNSSYMAYLPQWYPDDNGELLFMTEEISGKYDELAIFYGYSKVGEENPLYIPSVLKKRVDEEQLLFHTDENVDQDRIISTAHRNSMANAVAAPSRWMKSFARYRPLLFQNPEEHLRDVKRTFFFFSSITESLTNAATYVNGFTTDYRRNKLTLDDHTATVLRDVAEYLVGDSWRLKDLEANLTSVGVDENGYIAFNESPYKGSYAVNKASLATMHSNAVVKIAKALLAPQRVAVMEDPRSFLFSLITKGIIGETMDDLQVQTLAGLFSTVEYYRESYPVTIQSAFDSMMDIVTTKLKGEQHRSLVSGVVRSLKSMHEEKKEKYGKKRECGCIK